MKLNRMDPVRDKVRVTIPAAGAEWLFTNDHGEILMVQTVIFTLVTSATVASRQSSIDAKAGELTWFSTAPNTTQAASLTRQYCAFPGAAFGLDNAQNIAVPWPTDGLVLYQGHTLGSSTTAIQAADQYSAIVLDVIRFTPTLPEHMEPMVETKHFTFTEG